jgi:hypothetical protein
MPELDPVLPLPDAPAPEPLPLRPAEEPELPAPAEPLPEPLPLRPVEDPDPEPALPADEPPLRPADEPEPVAVEALPPLPVVEEELVPAEGEAALEPMAALAWMFPLLSLQCVAADTLPDPPELLPGEVEDCADAASTPPPRNTEASSNVLTVFIGILLG